MRRLTTIALALAASAFALSTAHGPAWADDEAPPPWRDVILEMPLYAGQSTLIGTVTVSTDGVSLFVHYDTNEDWLLSETHLYVGETEPMKSSPGQFPYGEEDLGYANHWDWSATLSSLGLSIGETVYVAAHAVAWEVEERMELTIVSDTNVRVVRINGEDVDQAAMLAWVHDAWAPYITTPYFSDSDAAWIWSTYQVTDPVEGETIGLRREFTLPEGYWPLGGTLKIAADNGYLAVLNGHYAAHHGVVLTDEHGGWMLCHEECHVPMWCWTCALTEWDLHDLLTAGANSLGVGAVNEAEDPAFWWNNPAGVIFEMTVRAGIPGDHEETAWASGPNHWKQGWGSWDTFVLPDVSEP